MVRTLIYGKENLKQRKIEPGSEQKEKDIDGISVPPQENYKELEKYKNNKIWIGNVVRLEKCNSIDPCIQEGSYRFYMNKLSNNRRLWSKDIKDKIKKFIAKNENKLKNNKKGTTTHVVDITDALKMEGKDSLKKRKLAYLRNSQKEYQEKEEEQEKEKEETIVSMHEILEKKPIKEIPEKSQIKEIKEIKGIEEIEKIIDMMEKEQTKQKEELMRSFIEREKEREREMIANGLLEFSDMSMYTGNSGSNTLYESLIKEAEEYQKDRNRIRNMENMKQNKEFNNERIKYIFGILNVGFQKIEALKALYRYYKNHFNKSVKEKMSKIHTFRYLNNEENFDSNFATDFSSENNKLNAIKKERLSRLFLYIEDINKIKQTLEMRQNDTNKCNLKLEIDTSDNKSEYFYDAIENIDDFFIFDDTFQYCIDRKDVDHVFWKGENDGIFRSDRLDEVNREKEWANEANSSDGNVKTNNHEDTDNSGRFPKFSLKDYYCFDLNKNLCYIHSLTPVIMIKKLAEKINAYNPIRNADKITGDDENEKGEGELRNENNNHDIQYYSHYAIDGGHNMDTYIQFHCEKWQENMYDIVEVNSLDVDFNFNCFKCNIMQIF